MKALTAMMCGALAAALAGGRVGIMPPPSYVARQVVAVWHGSGERRTLSTPGKHTLEFACTHVPGRRAPLLIEVERQQTDEADGDYRESTLEEVFQFARDGRQERVRFHDTLREEPPSGPRAARAVMLADGRRIPLGDAFMTAGRLSCLVPEEQSDLVEACRSALPGDEICIRGTVVGMRGGEPCVLVSGFEFGAADQPQDEPPWTVTVRWAGQPRRTIVRSGDHAVQLPCPHKPGATERLWVRLREFRMARLAVNGHTIHAELADTPEARSYGLQGRAGLEPDYGMLFPFPRPQRPVFVMKTVSFPLSIAFIRSDGTITNIERLNPGERRWASSPVPVTYVLEMSQGWFRDHEVGAGDRVVVP